VNAVLLLAQDDQGSSIGLLILLLPIAAIIFLTVVPQRKQRQRQAQLMASLEVGDEVVTVGGLFGVINDIEDDIVHLEVDSDVVVRVGRAAIARKAEEPDPAAARSRPATKADDDAPGDD